MQVARIIIAFLVWLIIVPACAGITPSYIFSSRHKSIGTTIILGWMFMWASFLILAVPFIVKGYAFSRLCRVYMLVLLVFAVGGIITLVVDLGQNDIYEAYDLSFIKQLSGKWMWLIFFLILALQIVMSVIYMTPDGDDSFYISEALISVKTDVMYRIDPYTGVRTSLDYRHCLSPFSLFIAFFSKRCGAHPLIVAHTIIPIIIILLAYLIYYKIGCRLFNWHREKVAVFMVLIAGIMMFGASSKYCTETFFLSRTWQGKAVLASVILPTILYLMLVLAAKAEPGRNVAASNKGLMLAFMLSNIAGVLMSSVWLAIMPIYEIVFAATIAFRSKQYSIVPKVILTMIPCYIYPLLFYVLRIG